MNKISNYMKFRFEDFWYDIYQVEKEQFKAFYDYYKYIEDNCRTYEGLKINYDSVRKFFMNKFLQYFQEAYSSLLLGNYNAYSGAMRIIIENYVCLSLIKIYKKKYLWKYWYIFSIKKMINRYHSKGNVDELRKFYEKEVKRLRINDRLIDEHSSYGWIKPILDDNQINKRITFRHISSLIDNKIYDDYVLLSDNIHNIDLFTKQKFTLMETLNYYLVILMEYTDSTVQQYNYHIFIRSEYRYYKYNLISKLKDCTDYWDFTESEEEGNENNN